ncbi:Signal transduction response regulator [Macleaya cordata]|uniref:histidine kinase n=1 Tax=Macleaya cordata TaxID=56857 RepID=A0A200RBT2_MACCD|nr:Signal transduction response regulator [Macleaya cordata]
MALNCILSRSNGRLSDNSKPKKEKELLQGSGGGWKWREKILILWVFGVIVWVLAGLGNSWDSSEKSKISDLLRDKVRSLHEHLNVDNNQLHALSSIFTNSDQKKPLQCIEKPGIRMQPTNDIPCILKVHCLDEEKNEKHHGWVAENIEAKDQCPVRNEYIHEIPDPPSLRHEVLPTVFSEDNLTSLPSGWICGKNISQIRALQNCKQEDCDSLPMCRLKIFWCVLVGMMVSWKISYFYERLWVSPTRRQVHHQQTQSHLSLQQSLSSTKSGGEWRRKLLFLFILSGLFGSIWMFWYINKNAILGRTERLANMCDERARMLQDQFNVSMNHVHALSILVSTFHHGKQPSAIDQQTFAQYTERTAFERPLTSGVAYALKVLHSEREQFEKQHGWTIKKMDTEDQSRAQDYIPEKLDSAPTQDEYAPVIFSQKTVAHIVSIDMMSGKEDRENILRARASGKGVLTSPFKLLKSNHLGVVLTFAVYNTNLSADATPEQRIAATQGYLGASYDVPSLVEKLLHQLASKQTIVVNVYDTTNRSAPINMYGPPVTDTGLLHVSKLDFGDPSRRHEMHCRFKQKAPIPWTAIMSSAGVLVITLLVGHIFRAAINRIAKVEDDYCEMMELKVRAEAADVAKSQFLATVSHEIRTPMNGVLGMLQMLMDTKLDPNQQDFAQTAYASGKDLISLINEVLDQAKIESGRLELEAVEFDLRTVLDNVLSLFSGKSHDKGIELAVYVSDQVPKVICGDPGRFRQIVTNLVGNSVKFTEKGHIFVSVHLADEVRNQMEIQDKVLKQQLEIVKEGVYAPYNTLSGFPVVDRWKSWENFKKLSSVNATEETEMIRLLVTVEDTGAGIPQDAQSRIFMPFMQADSSTSRTHGGTGIGLSISKCLVDMMGGEIGFVSEPGCGSTFTFSVIFTRGQTHSLDTKQHEFESTISQFRGLKGLVVDGKSTRAEVTRYHLQRLGISVDIATSLETACSYKSDACDSSAKTYFDMVLVEEDGLGKGMALVSCHLLKELRRNGRHKQSVNCSKIFLLATSGSVELDKLKSIGCLDDVILKPLRLSMTAMCFQQALGTGNKNHRAKAKQSNLQSLLNGKQILVVDDNIVNRRVAAGALSKCGAEVICVESGKAALEMLQPPHKFDACFMDLQMPEMDGFEATKQIRSFESKINEKIKLGEASIEMFGNVTHWHTPILAMTADVIQATHEKCMKWGMDDYVSKPFEEKQLYSAVMRFFESDQ